MLTFFLGLGAQCQARRALTAAGNMRACEPRKKEPHVGQDAAKHTLSPKTVV